MVNLKKKCINHHDLCWQGGECPYCEVEIPLRDEDTGRFVSYKELFENNGESNGDR